MANIAKSHPPGTVKLELFENPVEGKLLEAYKKILQTAGEKIIQKDYRSALKELSLLRSPVDDFFDGVMVMAEDERVKANRLSLLANIAQLFFRIGDFSKISTP